MPSWGREPLNREDTARLAFRENMAGPEIGHVGFEHHTANEVISLRVGHHVTSRRSSSRISLRTAWSGASPSSIAPPNKPHVPGAATVMSKMWPCRPTARPSGLVAAPTTVGLSSVPQQRQLTGVSAVRLFRVAPLVAPALCPVGFHSPTRRSSLGQRHSPPPALASLRRLPAPRRRPPTAGIE